MIFDTSGTGRLNYADCWLKIYRYYSIHYPFYQMALHSHEEWEIMYVVQGRCRIECVDEERETEREKEYELREGEYILLGGGVRHRLTVDRESPCRILNLEGKIKGSESSLHMKQLAREEAFRRLITDQENIVTGNDDGRLYEVLHALIQELKRACGVSDASGGTGDGTDGENMLAELLLGQFMLLLARQKAASRKKKNGGSVYVRRAAEYLAENFDREIRISDAAGFAGISEGYLQRLYKKETGRSLVNHIMELRVEKAKLLLETSSLPVIDIAVNVGFNSRQHFTAVFMQMAGCSPVQWRKNRGNIRVSVGFGMERGDGFD